MIKSGLEFADKFAGTSFEDMGSFGQFIHVHNMVAYDLGLTLFPHDYKITNPKISLANKKFLEENFAAKNCERWDKDCKGLSKYLSEFKKRAKEKNFTYQEWGCYQCGALDLVRDQLLSNSMGPMKM